MKKIINTKSKKKAAVMAVAAATLVMGMCSGCGDNKTAEVAVPTEEAKEPITETEKTELVTYEFETYDNVKVVIDENSIIAQETSEDPEYSDLVPEAARGNIIAPGRDFVYLEDDNNYYVADLSRHLITVADKSKLVADVANDEEVSENPGFFENDLWSITYDTDKWYGYVNEDGNTVINYLGECAGTSLIEISEVDVATAGEAIAMLEEKIGEKLTVEDIQTGEEYCCTAYVPNKVYESEKLYIDDFYVIYEHNGKVIVWDEFTTHDFDESRAEALADEFLETRQALVLK